MSQTTSRKLSVKGYAILLAAGKSTRMQGVDKVHVEIAGKPLWKYSDEILKKNTNIAEILVLKKGGKTRFDSAKKGFLEVLKKHHPRDSDLIIFHNAANPFLTNQELKSCIQKAKKTGACIVGHKAIDTIKKIDGEKITQTLNRENILLAQTPQIFRVDLLKKAYAQAARKKQTFTDEASLLESVGVQVAWVEASKNNKKITTPEDLQWAKTVIGVAQITGVGTDSHKFAAEGALTLGGIQVKNCPRLEAHSDGDVVLHALATALSQALGGGSLGTFADELFRNGATKSTQYLKPLLVQLQKKNLEIGHIAVHLECKKPHIDDIAEAMKKSIATILDIKKEKIAITATSGEGLTDFGKGLGIHCTAVVNLWKV
jgi:2-C-methyl-D-erythritol 4-phosphate cytidylyltransferase/2-C-methyl-D-erythritol 2,4-cyclodiphosphate synthase